MSKADEANAILDWVYDDPHVRAAEGLAKIKAMHVPSSDPDAPQVRGVGETLFMLAEAAKILHE